MSRNELAMCAFVKAITVTFYNYRISLPESVGVTVVPLNHGEDGVCTYQCFLSIVQFCCEVRGFVKFSEKTNEVFCCFNMSSFIEDEHPLFDHYHSFSSSIPSIFDD